MQPDLNSAPCGNTRKSPSPGIALVCAGALIAPLDTSVNVAFPAIVQTFGVPLRDIQWIVLPFVISQTLATLLFGRLGDVYGHRRLFALGLMACVVTHLATSLAPDYPTLTALRALQGAAVGMAVACAPALVSLAVEPQQRVRVLALYASAFSGGLVLGPILGGILVQRFDWPGVFFFRAPLALGVLMLMPHYLPLPLPQPEAQALQASPRSRPPIAWRELRATRFVRLQLTSVAIQLATFSILLWVPFALAGWSGLPVSAAGLLLATFPAGALLAGLVAAQGPWRPGPEHSGTLLQAGLALATLGLAGTAVVIPLQTPAALAFVLVLAGIGLGLFQVGYLERTTRWLPAENRGLAGALVNVTRLGGIVFGVTALSLLGEAVGVAATLAVCAGLLALWSVSYAVWLRRAD